MTIPTFAQDSSSWIGKKVVTKYDCPVTIGGRPVEKQNLFHVWTVKRTKGVWLWVVSGSLEGSIPASKVVPFDRAIKFYTHEIAANPGSSEAWGERGIIWLEKKEADIAIADFNEAIRLNPADRITFNWRGNAWSSKKDYDKAINDFNEAIRLDPTCANYYINRAGAWHDKTEYDKAVADYSEAIRLDPRIPPRTTGEPTPGTTSGSTTKQSPITTKRFGSIPSLLSPMKIGVMPGRSRRNTTRRLLTSTRRFGSIAHMSPPTLVGVQHGGPRRTSTRRLPTTTRPSGLIPRMHLRLAREARFTTEKGS